MINQNAWGEFAGVMFLYAATPDFRSVVIKGYIALDARIGNVSFTPGRPMTPLILLDPLNSDEMTKQIGERLMEVFSKAGDINWDQEIQKSNLAEIIKAQKEIAIFGKITPRDFVYHYCMFLTQQENNQCVIYEDQARAFIQGNDLPNVEDNE